MSHKEKLIPGFQTMVQILQSLDENMAEMQAVACDLSNTDKQAQKTGLFGGFSVSSPFTSPKYVQVYFAVDTPKGFDAAMTKICKELSYKCVKHVFALQHDVPLIVVCPISSRLEPDIDHALNGLEWKSSFIALVLHSGNEPSLQGLPTATMFPEKPKYKNAQFVDLAFSFE